MDGEGLRGGVVVPGEVEALEGGVALDADQGQALSLRGGEQRLVFLFGDVGEGDGGTCGHCVFLSCLGPFARIVVQVSLTVAKLAVIVRNRAGEGVCVDWRDDLVSGG